MRLAIKRSAFHLASFLMLLACSHAQITRVAANCTGTSSCTTTGNAVGDLEIAYAGVNLSATAPSLATGWTSVGTSNINGTSTADSAVRMACKVATGTSEASNTFTSATSLIIMVYRGQAAGSTATCASAILGTPVFTASTVNTTTTTETFGAVTNQNSLSWDVGFGYCSACTAGIATAPTGMANRNSITGPPGMGGHDTNATTSSFSSANVTLTTAGRIITGVVEIKVLCTGVCYVSSATGTATPLTIASTGSAHTVVVIYAGNVVPASVAVGAQTATRQGSCKTDSVVGDVCIYLVASSSSGSTSVTCTTCGTINVLAEYEFSGTDTTTPYDHAAVCSSSGSAAVCGNNGATGSVVYSPGFDAEAVITLWDCSASATTLTGSTWANKTFPNGNATGELVSSGFSGITSTPDSGCKSTTTSNVTVGIKGSGANKQCAADVAYYDYSAASGVNTNATVSASVNQVGDLIAVSAWCITTCGAGSVTLGSQGATQTTVSGNSSANTGQPFLFYVASATNDGTQTLTFAPSGSWTQAQTSYYDFTPSAGCAFAHDVDSSLGTGTSATPNTPSITPTTGDLLFNFTAIQAHLTGFVSPWTCNTYQGSGETGSCFFVTTVNGVAYIKSASAGATANNATTLASGDYQALLTSFTLAAAGQCSNFIALMGMGCQ